MANKVIHLMFGAGSSICGISDPPYEESTMEQSEATCQKCLEEQAKWVPLTEEESKEFWEMLSKTKPNGTPR